ncbi:unnamed protein product [Phaedon cochleariae]|uniref:Uncharacterized protein n=1 Tax=Phaedon cochleariae TaxID=80249 RepID=A0A9N9X201_PHACE|nr:unnamed protein product [Phaedon cochleariae]
MNVYFIIFHSNDPPEGSEDEIEASTKNLELDDHPMERAMVPPHIDSDFQPFTHSQEYRRDYYSNTENMLLETIPKISIKNCDALFDKPCDDSECSRTDLFYLRAREVILESGSLPNELELRDNGVFAKMNIAKCTRYGPFQGKWASVPQDARFAWEVSAETFT